MRTPAKFPLRLFFCISIVLCAAGCSKERSRDGRAQPALVQAEAAKEETPSKDSARPPRVMAREIQVTLRSNTPGSVATQLTGLTESVGGYVVKSDIRAVAPGTIGAEVTVRIPVAQVDPVLLQLRKMGEVRSEVRKGDDVTSEVVDTEARLTARRAFEKRLIELLANARSVEDMLKVEAELSRVRMEIEQLVGQSRTLSQRTEFALLTVTVEAPEANLAAAESFASRFTRACWSALSTSQAVILGLVEFFGALLPLSVLGLLVALPIRFVRRRAKRRCAALLGQALAGPGGSSAGTSESETRS